MKEFKPSSALLDTLYDTPSDFGKWSLFLEGVADQFDAFAVTLNCVDMVENESTFNIVHGVDPAGVATFMECLNDDPRVPVMQKYPNRPISDALMFSEISTEVWHGSKMYQDLFSPLGFQHGIVSWIPDDPSQIIGFGTFRSPGKAPFSQAETDCFGAYFPHVRRAVKLQKQFAKLEEQAWAALSVLDELPMGVIICDDQTRTLFVNSSAREIAAAEDGLHIRHGELFTDRQTTTKALRDLIREGVEAVTNGAQPAGSSLALPRRQSVRPLYVRVTPVWRNNAPFAVQNLTKPVCAVYVTDPDRPQETEVELLQRMFGLTPKEGALLRHLILGRNLNDASDAMGVSINTVRTHLQNLFAKTNASGQPELIRIVTTSPAWLNQSHAHASRPIPTLNGTGLHE